MLLTFHSPSNPLVVALRKTGQELVCLSDFRAAHASLAGCTAYYGNLFTEIKYPLAFLRLRAALRRQGIPYVFWNRDAPWNVGIKLRRRALLRLLTPVDVYLAHSMQTAHWFSRRRPVYFPNAARPEYCAGTDLAALREPSQYEYDVSFIGALGNASRRCCRERLDFLGAVRDKLRARGERLRVRVVDTLREPLAVDEQLRLIRTSRINLNYGAMCDLPGNPSWGLPERAFGIPAAGGFLLTEWRRSLAQTFAEGSYDCFHDAEGCVSGILHHLGRFDLMRGRAEELHRQVVARHSYDARARQLLELLRGGIGQSAALPL